MATFRATLSTFHTVNPEHNPFTVYVVNVKKGGATWQVYRRYKEWEDLRCRLMQQLGSAPPMPPKQLFGRMRPEVIENRVLGLNHFLQLCIDTPLYASHRALDEFLQREKNQPPAGIDPSAVLDSPLDGASSGSAYGPEATVQQQVLKELVISASQALVSMAEELPVLDPHYLAERVRMYTTSTGSDGETLPTALTPGSQLQLYSEMKSERSAVDTTLGALASNVASTVSRLLSCEPLAAANVGLIRHTAVAAAEAADRLGVCRSDLPPVVICL
mmetsp:Transcript_35595/g.58986  ORF Transcript_35595/g.58986 Transcript_35595/m.58986 type:complete len:274 (+) Transcript_35595:63-884(+)